ncbi:hypothetical protein LX32DRAFT_727580 [Colletotrichum zoysiae]|uniref:Nephrocystin 3-like N-terminal domain-containing protein n=1 Tax=Colletotrichum zoysiae TaxID=1216348 RepID=A0AAD9HJH2_9PEZI|nr:hypothetical protein LX32DRAFT_727580 [Colletotrichum zoysiae]
MAESLAALGVAANIVQFLELGLKAAISIVETYRSVNDEGWTARNADLESMAKGLRDLCDRLKGDADVRLDPVMVRLLQRCIDTADELSSELRGLVGDIATRHPKWAKFKVSLAAYFKRGKIDGIQARLVEIKTQIFGHVQTLLYDNRVLLSKSMRSIEEASEAWNRTTENRLNALAHDLRKLCESQSAAEAQNQAIVVEILKSLRFTQIKERQSEIPKAHRRTFEWVFHDDSPVDLAAWLRESSGLFWITGKPGSGKSTLMKFILGHEQTILLATRWASPEPLIVASHFFWSAGTTIQKSQEGLLRTLLFQILVNCPERLESWGIEELSEVFGRLKDVQPLPSRILLLIDGLDEYNGNLGDLVHFLESTSESPYIKVCCASRPWPVFLNRFDNVSDRIYMHELTANDMMRYIQDTLGQHKYFKVLQKGQNTEAAKLMKDIADKSEGVFFWVSLVVKSLLRGLDNRDDLAILQRRLSDFPSDLDKFFQRMLDTIESVYKSRAAMVFSMLLLANSSLPLVVFMELERLVEELNGYEKGHETGYEASSSRTKTSRYDSQIQIASEFLVKESQAFSNNIHYRPSEFEIEFSITQVDRKKDRILAQCRDLVQAWEVAGSYELQYNLRLGFLHRTVVEFLGRAADTQWQPTLPFKRYLLARSYLSFIGSSTTREFILRFLYTLQGADLQEIAEGQHLIEELFKALAWGLLSRKISLSLDEAEEMVLLLTQAHARISIAETPEARRRSDRAPTHPLYSHSSSGRILPWWLHNSGYVEVGDWAQVSWSHIVDLKVLESLLDDPRTMEHIHDRYPTAFSRFLVMLSNKTWATPLNAHEVCRMLIEHGFAGSAETSKSATWQETNPKDIVRRVGRWTSNSALTQSNTIEWLRINRVFSDSELRELEEAFPLQSTSELMALQKKKEERRGTRGKRS